MAGNDWVNSYLEAILDVGPGIDDAKSSLLLRERGRFSPTRYFVEEVVSGFDESDLYRSWVKAQATRSPQERNTRLENMCWRIWNLARQKKQLENEEAQRKAKRRMEREKGRREATADMSDDLSEGEKSDKVPDRLTNGDSNRGRLARIDSVETMEAWASQQRGKKLYLVLISLHGLIRCENMELGRDSDTGGQVKYVVELARALGSMPGVYRVDLLTRQVSSPEVDPTYGEPIEMLNPIDSEGSNEDDNESEMGESSGAYIVRIPFGPKEKYIPKEELWPYISEFVDGALNHVVQMSKVLGKEIGSGEPIWPVAIHGHYADAGDSAALLSGALNVPMIFTGHSLGRDKLQQLLKQGRTSKEEINNTYKIMRRIEAEELSLDASEIVITSTRQEIEEQWGLYDGFDTLLERKLRARIKRGVSCFGRFMPTMVVIPPGMEFNHIVPHEGDMDGEMEEDEEHPTSPSPDPPIWTEIMRFFSNPRKPMILALARPDPKKNITTLVKAFGECRPLRELANLTLIMGNRDGIDEMSNTNSSVLLSVLKLVDKYDLYGQVAYPKHHNQADVPEIYRLAAKTKGVFINPAFIEPFGLTLIEAAAHGLPMVATKNGGPVDIQRVLHNGLLIDPHDQQSIAEALLKLVADKHLWAKCRQDGLKNIHLYSWPAHCKTYLSQIATSKQRQPQWQISEDDVAKNKFPAFRMRKYVYIIAVDGHYEDRISETFRRIFDAVGKGKREDGSIGFILATSFSMDETRSYLLSEGFSLDDFDAYICNSGSEVYYSSVKSEGSGIVVDLDYNSHIAYRWGGEGLRKTLLPWVSSIIDKKGDEKEQIIYEDEDVSTDYCFSFKIKRPEKAPPIKEFRKSMRIQALRCHAIYCQNGTRLNVIPDLASRSQALRYLYVRWGVDLRKMVVFVGERGDTDYEGLVGGVHKTVILKGVCNNNAFSSSLQTHRNYPLSHVVTLDSPNIAEVSNGSCVSEIQSVLAKFGVTNAGA